MATSESVPSATTSRRAPYSAPQLVVYGSLTELTAVVGSTSMLDGGGGTMMRSGV